MDTLSPENIFSQLSIYAEPSTFAPSALDLAFDSSGIYLRYLFSQPNWIERVKPALGGALDSAKAHEIAQMFLKGELSFGYICL
jgi:hypothetical protein